MDVGPTDAVPVPRGGRLPVLVEGAGGLAWTCTGVGGVFGMLSIGMGEGEAGVIWWFARMGG